MNPSQDLLAAKVSIAARRQRYTTPKGHAMANDLHDSRSRSSRQLAAGRFHRRAGRALIQRVEQYDEQTRALSTRTFDAPVSSEAAEARSPPQLPRPMHGSRSR